MKVNSEINDLSAEIDRMIEDEQAEIWRSDPLQILDKISELTRVEWRGGLVGKWNSRCIIGFTIAFRVNVRSWYWRPKVSRWDEWAFWLCFGLSIQWRYGIFLMETN